jgi:hypothetical protein
MMKCFRYSYRVFHIDHIDYNHTQRDEINLQMDKMKHDDIVWLPKYSRNAPLLFPSYGRLGVGGEKTCSTSLDLRALIQGMIDKCYTSSEVANILVN